MKKILVGSSLLALAATLFIGCKTDTGAYVPQNATVNELENRAGFVLLGPGVQGSVTCTGIEQRTRSDGRLEVIANIRNRENRRIQVQVDCVFKDAQGFAGEGDQAPFQNLILTENV